MVPVMLAVQVAEQLGFSAWLGDLLAPVMGLVGLPGEAGLVWAMALLTGLYGGIGALVVLIGAVDLTALQLNILLTMILFAHAIPVEQAIVARAGGSFWATTAARVFCAIAFGFLLNTFGQAFVWLQQPASLGVVPTISADGSWLAWLRGLISTLVLMAAILFALLAIIDAMKRFGLFDAIVKTCTPFFVHLGTVPALAPLVTIGMLLGLTYGGGLIIDETKRRPFTRRELFVPLVGLSIIHALIEDTIVMIALGGNFWVIVVWRTAFALAVLLLLAQVMRMSGTFWRRSA